MLPVLREADRLKRSIGQISEGNVVGVLSLLMLAYSIYRQISSYLEQQKREQLEYRQSIAEAQNLDTKEQVEAFIQKQRQAMEYWRSSYIP
jgi:hypothetical protein